MTTALFLAGARCVLAAVSDDAVTERWDAPSVLEEQTVGGLAAHLARGGVWVLAEYLDAPAGHGDPGQDSTLDYDSAAAYYTAFVADADAALHQAVRDRGAALAAKGPAEIRRTLEVHLKDLQQRLPTYAPDHRMTVIGGKVVRLGDYLDGRIVEQTVHLDDPARSVGMADASRWGVADDAARLVIAIGTDIGCRRTGTASMLRALYRNDQSSLPVV